MYPSLWRVGCQRPFGWPPEAVSTPAEAVSTPGNMAAENALRTGVPVRGYGAGQQGGAACRRLWTALFEHLGQVGCR